MQRMIRDLLELSRVSTREREPVCVDMNAILLAAQQQLSIAIQESGAEIDVGDVPGVLADEGQMLQVFQNLIGNAVKFHGKDPPRIRVDATAGEVMHEFRVSDNGIGIDPAHTERVFAIFQRLHSRNDFPGTGIGLALVKRIVERWGGTIRFESVPGEGTTFFLTLPACTSATIQPEKPDEP
jgi:light-regulated signal transduction histidine kinase (bacteriophytochrome)